MIGSAAFWENLFQRIYRQGRPARSNFVGWTRGALAIGRVIIEDILGIDPNAPENTR